MQLLELLKLFLGPVQVCWNCHIYRATATNSV